MSDNNLESIFRKNLIFKNGSPDYAVYDRKLEAIQAVAKINNSSMFVVDLYKGNVNYVSFNQSFLPGYLAEELQLMGKSVYSLIAVDDQSFITAFLKPYHEFRQSLPAERREHIVLSLSNQFTQKEGNKYPINIQITPLLFDDNYNTWVLIGVVSLATKNFELKVCVDMRDNEEHFEFDIEKMQFEPVSQKYLTAMEKQVLIYSSRGYLDKEAVDMLNISVNTIKTHKRNILRKLNASNMTEASIIANSKKWI